MSSCPLADLRIASLRDWTRRGSDAVGPRERSCIGSFAAGEIDAGERRCGGDETARSAWLVRQRDFLATRPRDAFSPFRSARMIGQALRHHRIAAGCDLLQARGHCPAWKAASRSARQPSAMGPAQGASWRPPTLTHKAAAQSSERSSLRRERPASQGALAGSALSLEFFRLQKGSQHRAAVARILDDTQIVDGAVRTSSRPSAHGR